MKYTAYPDLIYDATRWFKNGDHPLDGVWRAFEDTGVAPIEPREGAVVRYYRHPGISGDQKCAFCGRIMRDHGWIDHGVDGAAVCPGDWIISKRAGEFYRISDEMFQRLFKASEGRAFVTRNAAQ